MQSGFAGAVEKDLEFDRILIGESVRAVIGNGGCFARVRGGEFRRNGVELENQQAEAADIRGPAAQMAHQIFFQFVGGDLFAQMRESAGGAALRVSRERSRRAAATGDCDR